MRLSMLVRFSTPQPTQPQPDPSRGDQLRNAQLALIVAIYLLR